MKKFFITCMLALAALPAGLWAQNRLPGYVQAEKFTVDKLKTMLFSTTVEPHWYPTGSKFWFTYKTSDGTQWYVVDAVAGTKRTLFDRDDMATQLTQIIGDPFDGQHLPITDLKIKEDGKTFSFRIQSTKDFKDKKGKAKKEIFFFDYNSENNQLTHIPNKKEADEEASWASVSPDGKTVIYAKDCNLYRMSIEDFRKAEKNEKDSTIIETALTTDGTPDFGYGIPYSLLNTDTLCNGKRRYAEGFWSPDSKHYAVIIEDNRAVKPLWVINSIASPRPTLETYKYQMPGEKEAPIYHLYIFNLTNNTRKEIRTAAWKDQSLSMDGRPYQKKERDARFRKRIWIGDNSRFYLTRSSRDLHRIDACSYTIGQDSIVPIIKERMNTYQEERPIYTLNNGKQLIWWSERDGWAHLYLYDDQGKLLNRITQGPWHVDGIETVDQTTRTIYFMANGREKGEHPYYEQLYKVNASGSNLQRLTTGDYFHRVDIDDDARYVVDNYSRVNSIPATILLDRNGRKIMTLAESDFSQLKAAGYRFPEPFKVKAADGVTDLYGVMYKPFNFDSTKVYPIIDYVYPGPQVEAVYYPYTLMSVRTDRLAQAGFIVISVGQRGGHPSRSKWYHNYGYGNMRDYPLADHKYVIEQLANRYSYIDITRVGIHGHSGGGFMSTAAICQYPDFFKVAVSCAGNHDNRIYNRWWSETHHGVKEEISEKGDTTFVYKIETNPSIAKQLKGHLLLVHGDIDNNVHPANTIRVVNALIRANKRFDMLLLPGQRHGFGDMNEYFYWRLVDYFSKYLNGKSEESVDIPDR